MSCNPRASIAQCCRDRRVTSTATALGSPLGAAPDSPGLVAWYAEGFSDRLGDRLLLFDNAGPSLELLRFRDELAVQPGFESALRARVDALSRFRHPLFTRIRSVTHLQDPRPQLALVSELPPGERLSTILRAVEQTGQRPDPGAVVWLLREILPALIALHESGGQMASGLVTPERVFVGPDGRLTLTEYALGDALSGLSWTPAKLWGSLGIPLRPASDRATIDQGSDVSQLALVALALLNGRLLVSDEFPVSRAAVEQACDASRSARRLRPWLTRALVPGEPGFASAAEALASLEQDIPGVMGSWATALLPRGLPPAPEPRGGLTGGAAAPAMPPIAASRAPALLEEGDVSRVPAPLVRLLGPSISTRRLWRLNAVLAFIICLEGAGILTFLMRVGTTTVLVAPVVPAAPSIALNTGSAFAPGGATAATQSAPYAPAVPVLPDTASILAAAKSSDPGTVRPQAAMSPVIGWLQVEAPVEVKVYANGRLLGSGAGGRYRLPAGRHLITLANDEQGIRSSQPVEIAGGRTVLLAVDQAPPAPTRGPAQ
jgi:hypothetical protein